jgi:phenylacetic acid degradation operon negative regulatory protein
MPKKELTTTSKFLLYLLTLSDMAEYVLGSPYSLARKWDPVTPQRSSIDRTIRRLVKQGWIKMVDKNNERFIKLTNQGQLEALLAAARIEKMPAWDGKWRVILFDIPEASRGQRDFFRSLLKQYNFKLLQQSVWVSPHPLNLKAITYLEKSGLNKYIRILLVEKIDNDSDLRRMFNVPKTHGREN